MGQFFFELSVVLMSLVLQCAMLGFGGKYMRKEGARRWD
jgi:type VI protein secretion system component VasF